MQLTDSSFCDIKNLYIPAVHQYKIDVSPFQVVKCLLQNPEYLHPQDKSEENLA